MSMIWADEPKHRNIVQEHEESNKPPCLFVKEAFRRYGS